MVKIVFRSGFRLGSSDLVLKLSKRYLRNTKFQNISDGESVVITDMYCVTREQLDKFKEVLVHFTKHSELPLSYAPTDTVVVARLLGHQKLLDAVYSDLKFMFDSGELSKTQWDEYLEVVAFLLFDTPEKVVEWREHITPKHKKLVKMLKKHSNQE